MRDEPASLLRLRSRRSLEQAAFRRRPVERFADDGRGAGCPRTDDCQATGQRQPSIAVLPFDNMSADKEQEYFSDGLAEEIINCLDADSWPQGDRPHVGVRLQRQGRGRACESPTRWA